MLLLPKIINTSCKTMLNLTQKNLGQSIRIVRTNKENLKAVKKSVYHVLIKGW